MFAGVETAISAANNAAGMLICFAEGILISAALPIFAETLVGRQRRYFICRNGSRSRDSSRHSHLLSGVVVGWWSVSPDEQSRDEERQRQKTGDVLQKPCVFGKYDLLDA
jgi:hypothetical protein